MKIDGGTAFPQSRQFDVNGNVISYESYGMSLRDYFAAAALQGILSSYSNADHINTSRASAKEAYERADAMLAERDKP